MEQSFSLKRSVLLFKSIWIIDRKIYTILLIMLIGGLSIFSIMDIINSRDGIFEFSAVKKMNPMVITWSFMSFWPFVNLFRYRNKLYINTSHIIPASINEKIIIPFIIGILFMIVSVVSYIIVLFLSWYISVLMFGNLAVFIDTLLNQGAMEDYMGLIYPIVSLSCMASLFFVLPTKYAWSGVCIWVLSMGISIFVFSEYDLFLVHYILLILTTLSWIIIYTQFKKIEIKK